MQYTLRAIKGRNTLAVDTIEISELQETLERYNTFGADRVEIELGDGGMSLDDEG